MTMTPAMHQLHDKDPAIGNMGLDCYSRGQDGSDLLEWSRRGSGQLVASGYAAKRTARVTKSYKVNRPWKEEYHTLLDDFKYNCWSKE